MATAPVKPMVDPAKRRGYIAELDGLRGIAILLVMVHRTFPRIGASSPWPIEAGWVGVDLFFVISGYLITGILLDTREDRDYFRSIWAEKICASRSWERSAPCLPARSSIALCEARTSRTSRCIRITR